MFLNKQKVICKYKDLNKSQRIHIAQYVYLRISNKIPHYEDLFSVNVSKQMELGRFLEGRYTKRRKLLSNGPRVNQ